MEDIKVGDYVRTKNGIIRKVETVKSGKRQFTRTTETLINGKFKLNDIVKHSKNIIDLIEVGDYMNGKKIDTILDGGFKSEGVSERVLCFEIDFPIEKGLKAYHNYDIKSIVTKEQMASIEYKI